MINYFSFIREIEVKEKKKFTYLDETTLYFIIKHILVPADRNFDPKRPRPKSALYKPSSGWYSNEMSGGKNVRRLAKEEKKKYTSY